MERFLELENVKAGYGSRVVLPALSLEMEKGGFAGIIGPNGAGKSTLLRTASGVLPPRAGAVRFQGQDLYRIPPRSRARRLAFVPQDSRISFSFTAAEVVMMGRYPYWGRFSSGGRQDREIVRRALELTDTLPLENRDIGELSAGERQRVIIARALAQEPELLFLDEATAHLDLGHQTGIFDLLRRLNREKKLTIISVSHHLNVAAEYCHQLFLLAAGTLTAAGTPEEVLREEIIARVYRTRVKVEKNPVTGKPYVIALPATDDQ